MCARTVYCVTAPPVVGSCRWWHSLSVYLSALAMAGPGVRADAGFPRSCTGRDTNNRLCNYSALNRLDAETHVRTAHTNIEPSYAGRASLSLVAICLLCYSNLPDVTLDCSITTMPCCMLKTCTFCFAQVVRDSLVNPFDANGRLRTISCLWCHAVLPESLRRSLVTYWRLFGRRRHMEDREARERAHSAAHARAPATPINRPVPTVPTLVRARLQRQLAMDDGDPILPIAGPSRGALAGVDVDRFLSDVTAEPLTDFLARASRTEPLGDFFARAESLFEDDRVISAPAAVADLPALVGDDDDVEFVELTPLEAAGECLSRFLPSN